MSLYDEQLEAQREANRGHGLTARELGTQVAMGGITAAAIGVIIALLILAGFVIAGVLSIVGALVIVAVLRLFEWDSAPGYGAAYRASVVGIFGFVAVAFLINEVLPVHEYAWDPDVPFQSNSQLLAHVQQPRWSLLPILPTLLVRFVPGLLVCAWLLQRNLRSSLPGPGGYLKAVVASLAAVVASSYIVAILGVRFHERIVQPQHVFEIFLRQLPGSLIAIAVFSVLGGLFSALVLRGLTRLVSSTSKLQRFRRFYTTAVMGLFAYVVLNTLVWFVYREEKTLDAALERMISSGDPIGMLLGDRSLFAAVSLWEYFVRQLPGLLLAAAVVAARLRAPYLRPAGYLKACLVGELAWPAGLLGIFGTVVALVYLAQML